MDWKEEKITNRKDRILFGSAVAALGGKIGDTGTEARKKLNKIGITDGINELKKGLENIIEMKDLIFLRKG